MFRYIPLEDPTKETRLLTLDPRSKDGVVRCNLMTMRFDQHVEYAALSYTWGSSEDRQEILLDGLVTTITKNLHSALYHLQHNSATRSLWIDALCIDQKNISERNEQVRQMHQIYKSAVQVLVWLGTADNNGQLAIELISRAGRLESAGRAFMDLLSSASSEQVYALKDFLRRGYWYRAWIIQEIALARSIEIYCGHLSVEWALFSRFVSRLANISQQNLYSLCQNWNGFDSRDNLPAKLSQIRDIQQGAPYYENRSFIVLLDKTYGSVCSDPRDKIYGMLALSNGADQDLKVDYSKSLFDVISDMILAETGIATVRSKRPSKSPTKLVLDIHKTHALLEFLQRFYQDLHSLLQMKTDKEIVDLRSVLHCSMSESVPIIELHAKCIGTLGSLGPRFRSDQSLNDLSKKIHSDPQNYKAYPIISTLSYGSNAYRYSSLEETSSLDDLLNAGTVTTNITSTFSLQAQLSSMQKGYTPHAVYFHDPERPYRLQTVVPISAEVGDEIWELLVPSIYVIMRPFKSSAKSGHRNWELIGRASLISTNDIRNERFFEARSLFLSTAVLQLLTFI
ncbi:hypothetical protein PVAG01_06044 [Phlyctema vagabunda]|uniref:Heterokaryon incompatibility domain-containing protein n=1 Tax=Phlyctema vagabunda TaxID=108571 RepID=A0ABR4PEY0_9HELO